MTQSTADATFKMIWITAFLQHFLIIIGFQECCMALTEILPHVFAGCANIRKHTYFYSFIFQYKTMSMRCIVKFWEG